MAYAVTPGPSTCQPRKPEAMSQWNVSSTTSWHVFGPHTPGNSSLSADIVDCEWRPFMRHWPSMPSFRPPSTFAAVWPSVRKMKKKHSGSCAHSSWHAAADETPSMRPGTPPAPVGPTFWPVMPQPTSKQPGAIGVWGRSTVHSAPSVTSWICVKMVSASPAWHISSTSM